VNVKQTSMDEDLLPTPGGIFEQCARDICRMAYPQLPPTPPDVLRQIELLEEKLMGDEPVEVPTEHVIHAGMYARTIVMPAEHMLLGALIKIPTLVIVLGAARVLAGDRWIELEGYNVIPASAGRKQVFVSHSPVILTMLFPTSAKTVEEAEEEMTDEAFRLLSRRQDANTVVITGM
jgi:hypothetical protein